MIDLQDRERVLRRLVDEARKRRQHSAHAGQNGTAPGGAENASANKPPAFDLSPIGEELDVAPEPQRWLLRHPTRSGALVTDGEGDGLLPAGKVGALAAAGGVGKSWLLIDLAVCIAAGRPWLGYFTVDRSATGKVLLLLAEEDQADVHRRIWTVAESLRLTPAEREAVKRRVVAKGLSGRRVALCEQVGGSIRETALADELLQAIVGEQWSLIVFDPLSRFGGVSTDVDNIAATFVIATLERFAVATGANVMLSAHSSKIARRGGSVDMRGASSLIDSVRWCGVIADDGERARFWQAKSNYSRPMPEKQALFLVRENGGRLRAQTPAERAADATDGDGSAEVRANVERVVAAVAREGRPVQGIDTIVALAGLPREAGRAAVRLAVMQGRLEARGTTRDRSYSVIHAGSDGANRRGEP